MTHVNYLKWRQEKTPAVLTAPDETALSRHFTCQKNIGEGSDPRHTQGNGDLAVSISARVPVRV